MNHTTDTSMSSRPTNWQIPRKFKHKNHDPEVRERFFFAVDNLVDNGRLSGNGLPVFFELSAPRYNRIRSGNENFHITGLMIGKMVDSFRLRLEYLYNGEGQIFSN